MSLPNRLILLCGIYLFTCAPSLKANCLADLAYLVDCVAVRDTVYMQRAMYRYTSSGKRETQRMLEALPRLEATLSNAMTEAGVPDWLKYLPLAESRLQSRAVSPAGAAGLWQIMPRTARSLGLKINARVDERLDAHKASLAAARYLKKLHRQFDDWLLALAAYNCGAGNVRKAQRRSGGYFYHEISRYLPRQTRRYIPRVLTIARIAEQPEKYGFTSLRGSTPAVTVTVKSATTLRDIAAYYCTTTQRLERLNPSLRSGTISYTQVPLRILLPGEVYFSGERVTIMRVADHLEAEDALTNPLEAESSANERAVAGLGGRSLFWRWG